MLKIQLFKDQRCHGEKTSRKTGRKPALTDIYYRDKGVLIGGTKQARTKQLLRPVGVGEAS